MEKNIRWVFRRSNLIQTSLSVKPINVGLIVGGYATVRHLNDRSRSQHGRPRPERKDKSILHVCEANAVWANEPDTVLPGDPEACFFEGTASSPVSENPPDSMTAHLMPFCPHSSKMPGIVLAGVRMAARSILWLISSND
jgi:hypothetical protein